MNDKEIEKGFKLVIQNAKDLLVEAKLLFDNGFYARAYSLTQLCIEEIGKSTILSRAILDYYFGEKIDFKYFEKLGFRKHQEKTKQSLQPELIAIWMFEKSRGKKTNLRDSLIEDFNQIDQYNKLKNDSLYVGLNDDSFIFPGEVIKKEMAAELIEKAELRLAAAEPLFRTLEEMEISAKRLKEVVTDPEKEEELRKRASEEFGINLL